VIVTVWLADEDGATVLAVRRVATFPALAGDCVTGMETRAGSTTRSGRSTESFTSIGGGGGTPRGAALMLELIVSPSVSPPISCDGAATSDCSCGVGKRARTAAFTAGALSTKVTVFDVPSVICVGAEVLADPSSAALMLASTRFWTELVTM
jgi:hypothetical protein